MKWGGLGLLVVGLAVICKKFDPAVSDFFPACPFHSLTGIKCPGCGSQRATHHLLNLNFAAAFHQNSLLVISIPYVLFGLVLDRLRELSPVMLKWRKRLYGKTAILLILGAIFVFWIFRNCTDQGFIGRIDNFG